MAKRLYLGFIAALLVVATPMPSAAQAEPTTPRQSEVAKKGAGVLPFDLARTKH